MHQSVVGELIERIHGRVKHIAKHAEEDPKFIPAMETIQMQMEVINHYASWVNDMKQELVRCSNLNQALRDKIESSKKIIQ